jgi:hypothetical protein
VTWTVSGIRTVWSRIGQQFEGNAAILGTNADDEYPGNADPGSHNRLTIRAICVLKMLHCTIKFDSGNSGGLTLEVDNVFPVFVQTAGF